MKLDHHLTSKITTHLKTLFVREKTRQNVSKKGETGDFSNADCDQKISEQSVFVPVLVFLVKLAVQHRNWRENLTPAATTSDVITQPRFHCLVWTRQVYVSLLDNMIGDKRWGLSAFHKHYHV